MNQAHGPLSSASDFLSIFEGGRSPEFWRQQHARRVEWTNTIQRSSGWLEEIVNVDLELSGQPLLGDTLAALMSRHAGPKTVATDSAAARATFSEPTRIGERESNARADFNRRKSFRALLDRVPEPKRAVFTPRISTKNDRAEGVLQLQQQAGSSLLRRIAAEAREFSDFLSEPGGGVDANGGKRNSAHSINVAERLRRDRLRAATLAAAQSTVAERFSPPTRITPVEAATLLERAARRIKMTLVSESLLRRALSSAVEPGGASRHDLRSLTDHWSMPLSGPVASANILMRLASADRSLDLLNDAAKDISSVDPLEQSLASSRVPQPVYDSTASASQTTRSSTPTDAPAIAPPSVTQSLPPLHSHKQDDVVVPVAAATAQRQARIEEHIAREDDLPLLAERLDRILKQEARRHGIDV
jgi:hypothetical protein